MARKKASPVLPEGTILSAKMERGRCFGEVMEKGKPVLRELPQPDCLTKSGLEPSILRRTPGEDVKHEIIDGEIYRCIKVRESVEFTRGPYTRKAKWVSRHEYRRGGTIVPETSYYLRRKKIRRSRPFSKKEYWSCSKVGKVRRKK